MSAASRVEKLLGQGIAYLRQGRVREARAAFQAALRISPYHADAHYLLASADFQAGLWLEAERHIQLALLQRPRRVDFLVLLGNIYQRQGKPERAADSFAAALKQSPDLAEIRLNLANVLAELGRTGEAFAEYDRALALKPDALPIHLSRALALQRAGRTAEARAAFEAMERRFPLEADVLYARGRLEESCGNRSAARALYEQVLTLAPRRPDAHNQLGVLLLGEQDFKGALEHFERALDMEPAYREALANAAIVRTRLGRPDAAAALYHRLLALDPANRDARLKLARLLMHVGRFGEARRELAVLEREAPGWIEVPLTLAAVYMLAQRFEQAATANARALAIDPHNFIARLNRALLLGERGAHEQALEELSALARERPGDPQILNGMGAALLHIPGREEEGLALCHQALEHDPDFFGAHYNLSFAYLSRGDFARGWHHHGRRWGVHEMARLRRQLACPLWRGESLDGKSILVRAEQGLGDHIMFASMLPDLVALGAQCTFECNARLVPLLQRSFPDVRVQAGTFGGPVRGNYDYWCPMSGLGEFLRRDFADFPRHSGYLIADSDRRSRWRSMLESLGPGRRIGIAWRGGTERTNRELRSIPLQEWKPLFALPGTRFISLQYGDCEAELDSVRSQGVSIAHWPEAIEDMDECAALICELDLVVSVTTTVIHLTGALGKEARVLVPSRPGWRYLREGEILPWYPSARMRRQTPNESWESVLSRVAAELAA